MRYNNIINLPNEILLSICKNLDDHSIVMLGWTNVKFRNLLLQHAFSQNALSKVKQFILHKNECINLINRIFRRNLCCEFGYVIHGECEHCWKVGFLREINDTHQTNNSKCICLENCN